jgi:hypothetical protein
MSRRTLFIVARVAGWLIVPLYVIGTCAGYFLTYSAGLWNEHAVVDNVESVMFSRVRCLRGGRGAACGQAAYQRHRLDHGHHRAHGADLQRGWHLRILRSGHPRSPRCPRRLRCVGRKLVLAPDARAGLIYLPMLFLDGRLLSSRWLPVALLAGVATLGIVLPRALIETLPINEISGRGIANPIGIEGLGEDLPIFGAIEGLFLVAAAGAVASVGVRFRRSRGVERQQMKLFVYVIVVLIGGSLLAGTISDVTSLGWLGKTSFELSMEALVCLPIAVSIAILRYRLYEIDFIINRTLVYGPLAVTLALVYFSGVATTQLVFRALTGQQQQPQLAIASPRS